MSDVTPELVERRVKEIGDQLRAELGLEVVIIVGSSSKLGTFIAGNGEKILLRDIREAVDRRGSKQ